MAARFMGDAGQPGIKVIISLVFLPVVLWAQTAPVVIPLWQKGAPGFESRRNEPEQAKDYWVKNIHNPSLTVFLPAKDKANGAAVVICPGGGHDNADGTKLFLNRFPRH